MSQQVRPHWFKLIYFVLLIIYPLYVFIATHCKGSYKEKTLHREGVNRTRWQVMVGFLTSIIKDKRPEMHEGKPIWVYNPVGIVDRGRILRV